MQCEKEFFKNILIFFLNLLDNFHIQINTVASTKNCFCSSFSLRTLITLLLWFRYIEKLSCNSFYYISSALYSVRKNRMFKFQKIAKKLKMLWQCAMTDRDIRQDQQEADQRSVGDSIFYLKRHTKGVCMWILFITIFNITEKDNPPACNPSPLIHHPARRLPTLPIFRTCLWHLENSWKVFPGVDL